MFVTSLSNFRHLGWGACGARGALSCACYVPACNQAFWAVMERGGYETVTVGKQWKEICRCLPGVDLTGQTSASYNSESQGSMAAGRREAPAACGGLP